MARLPVRLRIAAALFAAAALSPAPQAAPRALPRPLGGVGQLQAWFNANTAHVKAVLLLSPT